MSTTKALIIGALIALGGAGLYALMDEPSTGEQIGDSFDEGVEEVQDEFDAETTQ